jgi:hypothetical protein
LIVFLASPPCFVKQIDIHVKNPSCYAALLLSSILSIVLAAANPQHELNPKWITPLKEGDKIPDVTVRSTPLDLVRVP